MKINSKYDIGDEVYFIHNNRIVKKEVHNFTLDSDTRKSLEERLHYTFNFGFKDGQYWVSAWGDRMYRTEPELFTNIEDLITSLREDYIASQK